MNNKNVSITLTEEQVHVLALAVDWALDELLNNDDLNEEHPNTGGELLGLEAILAERIRSLATK